GSQSGQARPERSLQWAEVPGEHVVVRASATRHLHDNRAVTLEMSEPLAEGLWVAEHVHGSLSSDPALGNPVLALHDVHQLCCRKELAVDLWLSCEICQDCERRIHLLDARPPFPLDLRDSRIEDLVCAKR